MQSSISGLSLASGHTLTWVQNPSQESQQSQGRSHRWELRNKKEVGQPGELSRVCSLFPTLEQWYPTFLEPGTSFVEGNFSSDQDVNASDGGGGGHACKIQMKLCSPTARLWLCGLRNLSFGRSHCSMWEGPARLNPCVIKHMGPGTRPATNRVLFFFF